MINTCNDRFITRILNIGLIILHFLQPFFIDKLNFFHILYDGKQELKLAPYCVVMQKGLNSKVLKMQTRDDA